MSADQLPLVAIVTLFVILGVIILVHLKNAVFYALFRTLEFAVLYWLFTSGWPRVVALARAWKVWDFAVQVTAVIYDFVASAMNSAAAAGSGSGGGSPSEL
jgi:hypothetical protein